MVPQNGSFSSHLSTSGSKLSADLLLLNVPLTAKMYAKKHVKSKNVLCSDSKFVLYRVTALLIGLLLLEGTKIDFVWALFFLSVDYKLISNLSSRKYRNNRI